MTNMAQQGPFYELTKSIKITGAQPVDGARYLVDTIEERDALVTTLKTAFNGLQVYVLDLKRLYILEDIDTNTWRDFTFDLSPEGLEAIDEGNGVGWRLIGRNPDKFGNIGDGAVDFSASTTDSSAYGATGYQSFAIGKEVTAGGAKAFVSGYRSSAYGFSSVSFGRECYANNDYSFSFGYNNSSMDSHSYSFGDHAIAYNLHSIAIGYNVKARGTSSVVVGQYSETAKSNSFAFGYKVINNAAYSFATGRYNKGYSNSAFEVGVGESNKEENAIEVFDDGVIVAPSLTIDKIRQTDVTPNVDDSKILITKEYLEYRVINAVVVADEAELLTLKPTMKVWDKYIITLDERGVADVHIQIKFKTPGGDFLYEVVDNDFSITLKKV